MKYKPAVPDLLFLLDIDNEDLFETVTTTLKKIGSKDYIPYLNKHLDNKTESLMFRISSMIAKDNLVECLPALKKFITTCNRNLYPNFEYTISTCCGIGHFTDNATISFLLADYERFFSYKDTLESGKQRDWIKAYIETFTELKEKKVRPLIYRSIYDWSGFNEDFGKYPRLFEIKKTLEDSVRKVFSKKLQSKKYELSHIIAFIKNTKEVIAGANPTVKYLIEVTIPVPASEKVEAHQRLIVKELNLPAGNIYIRYNNGVYYEEKQERFNKDISWTPLFHFLDYAKAIPNQSNIIFLQALLDYNISKDEYFQDKVKKVITEIKQHLATRN